MADKEVLIEIKVDNEQATNNVTKLTKAIEGNKSATKELEVENKRLSKSGKQNSQQYRENAELIALNKAELTTLNRERGRAIKTANSQAGSLTNLRNTLARLTEARNRDLVVGTKAFNDANKNIASLKNQIKATEQAGGDFRSNVGNYGAAVDGLTGSVSKISPALGGMVTGFVTATRAALAFIATPIGAVLAAVGAAVAAVIQYFKRTEEGGDKLAVVMAYLSGTFEALMDVVSGLGKLLFDVFVTGFSVVSNTFKLQGLAMQEVILSLNVAWQKVFGSVEDYEKAQEDLSKNTDEIIKTTKDLKDAVVEGTKAVIEDTAALVKNIARTGEKIDQTIAQARAERDLQKETITATTLNAERNRQIFEGLKLAKDESLSFEERRKGLELASKAEQELADSRLKIARIEANIVKARFDINDSDLDARQARADAEAKVTEAETASLKTQTKIQASRIMLNKQEEAEINRVSTAKRKANEENQKNAEELLKRTGEAEFKLLIAKKEIAAEEINDAQTKAFALTEIERLKLAEQLNDESLLVADRELLILNSEKTISEIRANATAQQNKIQENAAKQEEDRIKKTAQIRKQNTQGYLSVLGSVFNTAGQLAGDNFELNKAFGIAEAVVNTARGVTQALGSAPPPLSFVTAGAVAVAGAAQIATIAKTKPDSNTSVTTPNASSVTGTSEPTADTSAQDQIAASNLALQNAVKNLGLSVSVTEINNAQNAVTVSEEGSQI